MSKLSEEFLKDHKHNPLQKIWVGLLVTLTLGVLWFAVAYTYIAEYKCWKRLKILRKAVKCDELVYHEPAKVIEADSFDWEGINVVLYHDKEGSIGVHDDNECVLSGFVGDPFAYKIRQDIIRMLKRKAVQGRRQKEREERHAAQEEAFKKKTPLGKLRGYLRNNGVNI